MSNQNHKDDVSAIIKGCIELSMLDQKKLYDYLFDNIVYSIRFYALTSEEMEDLIQEIFIKIFVSIKSYDSSKSHIKTWSAIISVRTCIDYMKSRKSSSYQLEDLNDAEPFTDNMNDFLAQDHIISEIENLPEKYREVFKLHVFSGEDHQDIGSILDISPSTSRVYLSRAKEILQKRINQLGLLTINKI